MPIWSRSHLSCVVCHFSYCWQQTDSLHKLGAPAEVVQKIVWLQSKSSGVGVMTIVNRDKEDDKERGLETTNCNQRHHSYIIKQLQSTRGDIRIKITHPTSHRTPPAINNHVPSFSFASVTDCVILPLRPNLIYCLAENVSGPQSERETPPNPTHLLKDVTSSRWSSRSSVPTMAKPPALLLLLAVVLVTRTA